MLYEDCRVNGPYLRPDGRMHIVVEYPNRKKTTISYPKFLVECKLRRKLSRDETIDHIDCDFTNNSLGNLQILHPSKHASMDNKRLKEKKFICPHCEGSFTLIGDRLSKSIANRKRGKAGPFCSRKCAGIYGAEVQNGKTKPLEVILISPEYTTLKQLQSLHGETHEVETAKTGNT